MFYILRFFIILYWNTPANHLLQCRIIDAAYGILLTFLYFSIHLSNKKSRVVYCHPKEINNSGFLYRIYPISQKYMFYFTILSFNTMPHFIVFCVSSLALLHRSATKQYVRHNTNG